MFGSKDMPSSQDDLCMKESTPDKTAATLYKDMVDHLCRWDNDTLCFIDMHLLLRSVFDTNQPFILYTCQSYVFLGATCKACP